MNTNSLNVCVMCQQAEGDDGKLTWTMSKQDIGKEDITDVKSFLDQSSRSPIVIILPDDGGIMVYAIERYCHDCFDEVLATYEETNTATSKMTGKAFRALVAQEAREHDWFVYGLVNSHLAPRGSPNFQWHGATAAGTNGHPQELRTDRLLTCCVSPNPPKGSGHPEGRWFNPTPYLRSRMAFSISAWRRWSASRSRVSPSRSVMKA